MITFNRFKGSKGLFEEYKKEGLLDLKDEAIVFIYDDKDRYIYDYSTDTYFGSTEIYIGSESPALDGSIKLWIDTNDSSIKYNPNNESWITISSGEGNLIYIGENPPADDSDYVVWINPDEVIEDDENLKTLDNESLLGKGNIDLESKYLKKTDAEAFITEDEVAEQYQPKGDYLTPTDLPTLADVAFTGNFNDLVNIPDFNLTKESCTIYTNIEQEDPRAKLSHEQALSNKDAFVKIKASVSNETEVDITVITVSNDGTETEYKNCFITNTSYSDTTLTSVSIESALVVQNIDKPYIAHIVISQFTNGWEHYEEGWDIPASYADVNKKYLATPTDINNHTTTYIGTTDPSTISSKYNLWVDTTNEDIVFRYKDADNAWQILSTGGNDDIIVDTELNATSENPIANKVVYNMNVSVGEAFSELEEVILKKADTENGLIIGRGFKVSDTKKYYLPDTFVEGEEGVENTNILATKAEVLSNEVIDNKATVYNLYAMDELTTEQLAANEAALVSVQNKEVAIYKVYTNDDTYAIADVKLIDGPYLEAYVYVNNPDTTSKQATITKYTYSFNQAGVYTPNDEQEVIVPSKEEIISNEEVIASAFNNIHIVIKDIKENISKNITKEELQYEIEDLRSKIIANEEVIANALSDLNTKFLDLESRLRDVEKNTEQ